MERGQTPQQTNNMTNKATSRPTSLQLQKNQARLDRKAAAAERRADRAAGLESVTQQNVRLYSNIGK